MKIKLNLVEPTGSPPSPLASCRAEPDGSFTTAKTAKKMLRRVTEDGDAPAPVPQAPALPDAPTPASTLSLHSQRDDEEQEELELVEAWNNRWSQISEDDCAPAQAELEQAKGAWEHARETRDTLSATTLREAHERLKTLETKKLELQSLYCQDKSMVIVWYVDACKKVVEHEAALLACKILNLNSCVSSSTSPEALTLVERKRELRNAIEKRRTKETHLRNYE